MTRRPATADQNRTARQPRSRMERLRASPNFSLHHDFDGRPYVMQDVEPYLQYWLDERDRVLLSLFGSRRGATVDEAIDAYVRLTGIARDERCTAKLRRAIDALRAGGVVIGTHDDTSRYTDRIVRDYAMQRPFPARIAECIVAAGPVRESTDVLDLAGGPGDLALALAAHSRRVATMDLSKAFARAAAHRARARGLPLTAINDSCNRLVHRDDEYDVVTISQALHWLDDVMVCRGICRGLRNGGSFFVIHGAFDVADAHPLAYLFGAQSILGARAPGTFARQSQALLRRLTLLFDALDAPDVQRVDLTQRWGDGERIVPAAAQLFHQRRPMDENFARAFLTEQHIASSGQRPDAFWRTLQARTAGVQAHSLQGSYHWALLHFRRGGPRASIDLTTAPVEEIAFLPGAW